VSVFAMAQVAARNRSSTIFGAIRPDKKVTTEQAVAAITTYIPTEVVGATEGQRTCLRRSPSICATGHIFRRHWIGDQLAARHGRPRANGPAPRLGQQAGSVWNCF
jgi:hypothetical protein